MTASLYQSALSGSSDFASGTAVSWLLSRNTEDVRRQGIGIQLHEVAPAAPGVTVGGDEVVQLVARAGRAIEIEPAALRVFGIQVDGHQNEIVARLLRVAQQLVVVGGMEAQAPVALQGRVFLPHLVELRDQAAQAVRPLAVTSLDLVLLAIHILVPARNTRRVLHQLERRPV